jgi:hypothetical protein
MTEHAKVRHPSDVIKKNKEKENRGKLYKINDDILEWVTNHVLASVVLFDIALIVPLLAIPAPNSIKITLGVISGSWIQLWALPALQRSQNSIQAQNDAKAEVDHETLTYLANLQDEQMVRLHKIDEILDKLEK